MIKKYRNFTENKYVNRKLKGEGRVFRATSACGKICSFYPSWALALKFKECVFVIILYVLMVYIIYR
jgi:hypothetical protein